jgi:hypothetical protein
MGLDVFLYCCDRLDEWEEVQREYEEKSEAIWEEVQAGREYKDLTDEEKRTITERCEKLALSMGLEECGAIADEYIIEEASEKYPEHMFKIGYFRSSYNSGGTNSVLERLGVPNLYDIFVQQTDDEYHRRIDWEDAKKTVKRAIAMLRKINDSPLGEYYVKPLETPSGDRIEEAMKKLKSKSMRRFETKWFEERIGKDFDLDRLPSSEREAMAHFVKQLQSHEEALKKAEEEGTNPGFVHYSNWLGEFNLKGMEVFGFINGVEEHILHGLRPCIYAVFKLEDGYNWYLQALEIIEETIDFVLAQDDPDIYYLHWSG